MEYRHTEHCTHLYRRNRWLGHLFCGDGTEVLIGLPARLFGGLGRMRDESGEAIVGSDFFGDFPKRRTTPFSDRPVSSFTTRQRVGAPVSLLILIYFFQSMNFPSQQSSFVFRNFLLFRATDVRNSYVP